MRRNIITALHLKQILHMHVYIHNMHVHAYKYTAFQTVALYGISK